MMEFTRGASWQDNAHWRAELPRWNSQGGRVGRMGFMRGKILAGRVSRMNFLRRLIWQDGDACKWPSWQDEIGEGASWH